MARFYPLVFYVPLARSVNLGFYLSMARCAVLDYSPALTRYCNADFVVGFGTLSLFGLLN